jgi:hypothetical protein
MLVESALTYRPLERLLDTIIVVLLVVAAVKFVIVAIILLAVFRPDIRQWRTRKKPVSVPACPGCRSKYTRVIDEGQTRWDHDDLVLVTTYECRHCHFPFWHVERVPTGSLKR